MNEHPGLQYLLLFPLKREKSHRHRLAHMTPTAHHYCKNTRILSHEGRLGTLLSLQNTLLLLFLPPKQPSTPISFCAGHLLISTEQTLQAPLPCLSLQQTYLLSVYAGSPSHRTVHEHMGANTQAAHSVTHSLTNPLPSLPHQCNNCFQGLNTSGCPNCYRQFC